MRRGTRKRKHGGGYGCTGGISVSFAAVVSISCFPPPSRCRCRLLPPSNPLSLTRWIRGCQSKGVKRKGFWAREKKLVSWICIGSGLIVTDRFVYWFIHSFVRNMPFAVGSILWFVLEGRDGIMFFTLPLS